MKDTLRKKIQPYGARLISSNGMLKFKRQLQETKRKVLAQPHNIDVYLRLNDPYSYLLVQVLGDFEQRFGVRFKFRTTLNLQQDMYPEVDMWHDNGFIDATHLANLYGLEWPAQAPEKDSRRVLEGSQLLLQLENQSRDNQVCDWVFIEQVFKQYWFQEPFEEFSANQLDGAQRNEQLRINEEILAKRGHYMSAMLNYAGEWYWGLDRLDHLEKRLLQLGLGNNTKPQFDKTYRDFCTSEPLTVSSEKNKALTFYFSIRSPYSHLGLEQAIKLAKHYQLALDVKPVLPMIMRGLLVPDMKKMYIFHDTKREAEKLGIDYGFVADPLGEGVNRCYSLFQYAKSLGKETEYLLNYAQAVNAQGIHSDTDAGLKEIVSRSGLDWTQAKELLNKVDRDKQWQVWAEDNRKEMVALGSWGVPTFKYGDVVLWGQDRAGLIERIILQDLQ